MMEKPFYILITFVLVMFLNTCNTNKQNSEDSEPSCEKESFLGQHSPGLIPKLFAPGIVSTGDLEIEAAISASMEEFYFIRQKKGESPRSHLVQVVDGEWQESEVIRPSGEVFISTDNKIMFLGNKYKERTPSGWTEERSVGATFEQFHIMRLTASARKTYFFDEREEVGIIRYSNFINGKREEPQALNNEINTGKFTSHPFIAPDESYLIWDSEREGGYGASDLYISFRQKDGLWGPAINMGTQINTEIDDTYGSVSSDGKYFFFNRVELGKSFEESEANIYWMNAKIIEYLKSK